MIVYLDLDRTVFQTARVGEIWEQLSVMYPERDVASAYDRRNEYYSHVDDAYYHDMSAQLLALGLEPTVVYEALAGSELADGRFEYDGLRELIQTLEGHGYEVRVLTFGSDDYQHFKAALCPSLRGIEVVTTLRSKADVLEELGDECWLVDDKALGDELPNNVSFVQLCHDEKNMPLYADWTVKRTLKDVKDFFDAIMH